MLSNLSKLDPNSKPFAPRFGPSPIGQAWIKVDENRNNIITKAPPRNQVLGGDDFGLRALAAQIEKSKASRTSETSSILKEEDLNFPGDVERHFAKPSYQYMESPFNNRVVGPLGDCNVPKEYLHRLGTKGALPDIYQNISKMATDLLFFLFYMSCKDALQVMIGNELFNRGWRYHKTEKLWVARLPNVNPTTRDRLYEEGEYQYFNKDTWTRDRKRMVLEYDKLATQQQMPTPSRMVRNNTKKPEQPFAHFHQLAMNLD